MTNCLVADEIMDVVVELFQIDRVTEGDEWKMMTAIEFGVLSWHLGSFYCCPLS